MITGEDIDRCLAGEFEAELSDMNDQEIREALHAAREDVANTRRWIAALEAKRRLSFLY